MIKVILTQDVPQLGKQGDVVDVADGYARNYLVPRRMAVRATDGALRQAELQRTAREEAAQRAREEAQQIADALTANRVVIAAQAGDEGKLYGSIGTIDVVEAIRKFTGIDVERKSVRLFTPIKEIGLHEVTIQPHPDVEFQIVLDVIPA